MKLNVDEYVTKEKLKLADKFRSIENPKLWILTDHSSVAAESYLRSKTKIGNELGVDVDIVDIGSEQELKDVVKHSIQYNVPIILQLPCKKEYVDIYNELKPKTDVDGFFAYEDIYKGNVDGIVPATPKGILKYIHRWCIGKNKELNKLTVTILGRGELVGKPLAALLNKRIGTLNVLTSRTHQRIKDEILAKTHIVILATGNDMSLGDSILSKARLVLDCGVFRDDNGKLYGEFTKYLNQFPEDIRRMLEEDIDYTPVPKGVGILTTLSLFDNVYQLYNKGVNCNDSN